MGYTYLYHHWIWCQKCCWKPTAWSSSHTTSYYYILSWEIQPDSRTVIHWLSEQYNSTLSSVRTQEPSAEVPPTTTLPQWTGRTSSSEQNYKHTVLQHWSIVLYIIKLLLLLVVVVSLSAPVCTVFTIILKGKGKVHPRTGHKGPEVEKRYSSTPSLTLALDGVGG
jgi:hypothetical protein